VAGGLEEGIHSVDLALDQIVRIDRDCQLEGVRRSQVACRSLTEVVPDDLASYVEEHRFVDSRVWRGIGFGEMARGSRRRVVVEQGRGSAIVGSGGEVASWMKNEVRVCVWWRVLSRRNHSRVDGEVS
jgi:hypothetical protein